MVERKALIIGIDRYKKPFKKLKGCTDDAKAIASLLKYNYDRSPNFDVKILLDKEATYDKVFCAIESLFSDGDLEAVLLYFAGHGRDNKIDGQIVTVDGKPFAFKAIMDMVNKLDHCNKIVILDCCHSGKFGNKTIGDITEISKNTTIITSCSAKETAKEKNGRGVVSSLIEAGLSGGAANVLGEVSPSSLYSYIDKSMTSWEQRPFFKAHVSSFISIRQCEKRVTEEELYDCMKLFKNPDYHYNLNPSYEITNSPDYKFEVKKPYAKEENVAILNLLQKMNRNGIIEPVDEKHMYFAAMNSKCCILTPMGKHLWNRFSR